MSEAPKPFHKRIPKQARARELTEAILTAATGLFKTTDFVKATTNRIAELAGVSIGSLYQYFPNKDSLVGVLIERRIRSQLDALDRLLEVSAAEPCEKTIRAIVALIARDSLSHRKFMRTLYQRGIALDLAPATLEAREKACRKITAFLQDHHGPRLAATSDPELSVFCAVNGVLGVIFASALSSTRETETEKLIDELARMATGHLLKTPDSTAAQKAKPTENPK